MGEPADAPIKLRSDQPARTSSLKGYGRDLLWARDAKLGYASCVLATVLLAVSTVTRARLDSVASSAISVSALGLTFVLASLSLLSGLMDTDVVRVLDHMEKTHGHRRYGVHGVITAFRFVAAVGALGVVSWLGVRWVAEDRLRGNGWDAAQTVLGGLATGLTVWLVVGLFQLIGIIATLVSGKARVLRQRAEREGSQNR